MIGRNCSGAWELSEIITASNNRLYAYRTCLGWCAAEPVAINKIKETKLPCSRVLVQGFGSQDVSKYFFESKTKVTEDDIKVTEDDIKVTEDDIKVTEDDIKVTEDDIKVTEDDIKVTEDDINGILEPIYLAEFPEKYSGSGDEK